MSAPRTYKTEAIVLKHVDLGEADRILTLYTPNCGKIRAVAKGVRKMKSKLGGHVEPLTQCSLMLSKGRNLEIVSQGQCLESFIEIRYDLWLTAQALYLADLTDSFTSEHIENYPVYKLLLDSLHQISKAPNIEILFRFYEIQILGHMGYQPQLIKCLNCNIPLEPVENYFSINGGGILCSKCYHTEASVHPISVNTLKVLRLLQRGDYATASRLQLTPELSKGLEKVIHDYIRYLLEKDLKSTGFLNRLKKDGLEIN